MAVLNYKVSDSSYSLADTGQYAVSTLGTARLNVKVNSTSTAKWGLCSDTDRITYDKLRVKVGSSIAGIGRTASISYISGNTPQRNGSSTFNSNTKSETTGSAVINTVSASGTSAADPKIRTSENNTGITVTSKTASAAIQVGASSYTASTCIESRYSTRTWTYQSAANKYSSIMSQTVNFKHAWVSKTSTAKFTESTNSDTINTYASTTGSWNKFTTSTPEATYETKGQTDGSWTGNTYGATWTGKYMSTYSKVTLESGSKSHIRKRLQSQMNSITKYTGTSANYSTRWSYSTSSGKKTSYSRTSVSESLHNFNI